MFGVVGDGDLFMVDSWVRDGGARTSAPLARAARC